MSAPEVKIVSREVEPKSNGGFGRTALLILVIGGAFWAYHKWTMRELVSQGDRFGAPSEQPVSQGQRGSDGLYPIPAPF